MEKLRRVLAGQDDEEQGLTAQDKVLDLARSLMPQHSALVLESDGLPYALLLAFCVLFLEQHCYGSQRGSNFLQCSIPWEILLLSPVHVS
ncbi:hypothetical protein RLOC_00005435 [Lonchura striata]|uniref:Uncharacterized protein n=1 Tax=Lonchura striata TaxID=40157 RepID=A0A218V588_9PASE|nr:hypothetical protein RLOC_00005435 [Lonchura striata domestica]